MLMVAGEGWGTNTASKLLLTLTSSLGSQRCFYEGRLESWYGRRTGNIALRIEVARENCARDCKRTAAVDEMK